MQAHEHYREAERLVAIVENDEAYDTMLKPGELIDLAQVHATLALAAAHMPARLPTVVATAPAQGDLIDDQMGDVPQDCHPQECGAYDALRFGVKCVRDAHDDEVHVDAEGREFR